MCGGGSGPPPSEKDNAQVEEFNKELEQDKEKYKNGPIGERSITDCICCLIFLVAIVGFVGASYYGWSNGDPNKLLIGWDSDGNGCGYSEKTADYTKLYWPEPPSTDIIEAVKALDLSKTVEMLNYGVCVKECPSADANTPVDCSITDYIQNN